MSVQVKGSGTIGGLDEGLVVSGIVTSSTQINVGSNIKLGSAGVVTATSFVGNGSNLTGISAGTSLSGSTNNTVCTVTGANAIQGESGLTYDGTTLSNDAVTRNIKSGANYVLIGSSNAGGVSLGLDGDSNGDGAGTDYAYFEHDTSGNLNIVADNPANASNIIFKTNSTTERLRIDSDGRVLIGTTTEGHTSADDLTLATSGNTGMTIRSGTSNDGSIFFSDGTSGGDEYRGYVQYNHPNDKLAFGTSTSTRLTIDGDGRLLVGNNSDSRTTTMILSGNSSTGVTGQGILNIDIGTTSVSDGTSIGVIRFGAIGDRRGADVRAEGAGTWQPGTGHPTDLIFGTNASNGNSTPTERMRLRSDGHLQLQHGLTALSGGGVIVCAAKSSSGTANQSNYKVDFVVPMGDLGTKQEYEDIRAQFSSGQTGVDWSHALGGSGILIATVQNNYYWGFRTKIYHITTYGNSSNNVTQLNLLHNYSAAGHGGNSASVDLAVQSHDGKTPKLRATFSGDYWNSNVLTVTYIGSAVASTGNIRQLTTFDSKLTGQDPTWK